MGRQAKGQEPILAKQAVAVEEGHLNNSWPQRAYKASG